MHSKQKRLKNHFLKLLEILKDLIHTNIYELNGILTREGNQYFITFMDDYSKHTCVYLIKHKDQAFQMFKMCKSKVENEKKKNDQNFMK